MKVLLLLLAAILGFARATCEHGDKRISFSFAPDNACANDPDCFGELLTIFSSYGDDDRRQLRGGERKLLHCTICAMIFGRGSCIGGQTCDYRRQLASNTNTTMDAGTYLDYLDESLTEEEVTSPCWDTMEGVTSLLAMALQYLNVDTQGIDVLVQRCKPHQCS